MGLWTTVKGWLNIGGVKVRIQDMNPMLSKSGSTISGKVLLTSKSDKHVRKMIYKLVLKESKGRGQEKETKEFTLTQNAVPGEFDIKPGEEKVLDFTLTYSLQKHLKDMGGVLGAVGKLGAFAAAEKDEYSVVAECDVQGAAFNPSHRVVLKLVD